MNLDAMPLTRQVDFVFKQLADELLNAQAGTVIIQIRNNAVGKYGIRHHPIESRNGQIGQSEQGMTQEQIQAFRQMAIDSIKLKRNWTHGEIMYDFSVRTGTGAWSASILFESNYNMASSMFRYTPKFAQHSFRDAP
ncbi:O-methyltransferase [Paenibacillus lignilyticus]|uniref:O-methyltransferase n=1 Tax=Paenibacillus lignilyticus TaxID=1172615 RepID=A0ABS5C905_9BACL|nr:O-methyltransferase [Paenibacillus lignilyticus]MBP3962310.1 O-methyltransferase [Paenibacillus lignilyticus]